MARFVWDAAKNTFVDAGIYYAKKAESTNHCGIVVIGDLQPYRNTIDRKVIGGRRQHRDFLRAHGVVEVGNEKPKLERREPKPVPGLKQEIVNSFKKLEGSL